MQSQLASRTGHRQKDPPRAQPQVTGLQGHHEPDELCDLLANSHLGCPGAGVTSGIRLREETQLCGCTLRDGEALLDYGCLVLLDAIILAAKTADAISS